MKKRFLLLPLILAACASEIYRDQSAEIRTTAFEVEPYLGLWYEIARYPNWFEKGCTNVTAEYGLREDGRISVKNSCLKNGALDVANGVARSEGEGKLGVSFTPWLPWVWGDYWLLDRQGYRIAVIGNPKGSTGWILARTPSLTDQEREWAENVLKANGYDPSGLENVKQEY